MTKISFDFDGTLGHKPHIQRVAREMSLDQFYEVHIITRRYGYVHPKHGDEMSEVLGMADALRIKRENIHFLDRKYKAEKIKELGIRAHWDDDFREIQLIREHAPECMGFLTF
jgi:hypothetical protein